MSSRNNLVIDERPGEIKRRGSMTTRSKQTALVDISNKATGKYTL